MYWPYLIPLALLFAVFAFGQRKRKQQVAQEMVRIAAIGFGDDVMTTSGLYGTVVGRNDDGTVQLAIAPGVEVKWALAALRDAKSLPAQYRKAIHDDDDSSPDDDANPSHGADPAP